VVEITLSSHENVAAKLSFKIPMCTRASHQFIALSIIAVIGIVGCCAGTDLNESPKASDETEVKKKTPGRGSLEETTAKETAADETDESPVADETMVERKVSSSRNGTVFRNTNPALTIVFPEGFVNEDLGSDEIIANFMHETIDATIRVFPMDAPDGPDAIYDWNKTEVEKTGGSQIIIEEGELAAGGEVLRWIITEIPALMPPIRYKHYLVPLTDERVIWIHTRVPRSQFRQMEASFDGCAKTIRIP
jgi:hypothetical protein